MSFDAKPAPRILLIAPVLVCALLALWNLERAPASSHAASRLGPAICRVDRGTWRLDDSRFLWTHDKIFRDGHFYSDKPPAMDWLVAAIYAPLAAAGVSYAAHPILVYRALVFTLSFLPYLGVVWLAALMTRRERHGWTAPAAAAGASLLWPYATTLSHHALTAFLVMAGLWASRRRSGRWGACLAVGFVAGAVELFDVPLGGLWALALGAIIVLGARAQGRSVWRPAVAYALGVMAVWALGLALNYDRNGSVLAPFFHAEWYQYEGSVWASANAAPARYASPGAKLWHLTFGHYGVFLTTPLLLFALAGAWRRAAPRESPDADSSRVEATAVMGCAVALVAALALNPTSRGSDLGGGSYGFRWFTPMIAPLFLYLPGVWARLRTAFGRGLMVTAGAVSVLMAAVGVIVSPWPHNAFSPYPFLDSLCAARATRSTPPHPIVEATINATSADLGLSYHDLGTVYFRRGFFEAAVAVLEKSVRLDPERLEGRYILAQALERSGELARAEECLKGLLALSPGHTGALNQLGITFIRQQRPLEALSIYETLLRHDPNDISALNNSALILSAAGQTTEALRAYDRSLAVSADNFEALYNRALILARQGDLASASENARAALDIRPDHAGCRELLERIPEGAPCE